MSRNDFSCEVLSSVARHLKGKKIKERKIADSVMYEKGDREIVSIHYSPLEFFRKDLVATVSKALSKEYNIMEAVNRQDESWINCSTKNGKRNTPFSVVIEFHPNKEKTFVCIQTKL